MSSVADNRQLYRVSDETTAKSEGRVYQRYGLKVNVRVVEV